ncbi:MAG: TonB-dependent receptor, partial [Bacteroidia bacterium]|nr:TonB-dependent receptor [Bacteroidia bacterium]
PSEWPEHEKLSNVELGYRFAKDRIQFGLNLYAMEYKNQLVLTGAVNDVGEVIRTNVDESYRRGIELVFQYPVTKKLQVGGNATFSDNRITRFTESIGEWDGAYQTFSNQYNNTSISYSPNTIAALMLSYKANSYFTFNMQGKHVGQQFLDNTENQNRKLDAFTILDASVNYNNAGIKGIKNLSVGFYLNNILNQFYAPNGYTFSGVIAGNREDFNYLYPMAGFNWMMKLGVTL